MLVTIHGPSLADQSEGTYRVHAADAPENAVEVESNGSVDPIEVEVGSREDVVEALYPAEQFERRPEDLPLYLADLYFGPSLNGLPTRPVAEDPESRAAYALEVYGRAQSFRAVARELGVADSTAKKMVEAAQEAARMAEEQRAVPTAAPRSRAGGNPNAPGPGLTRTCHYRDHEGQNPLPFESDEHFALRKGGAKAGTAVGWCRTCSRAYSRAKRGGTFVPLADLGAPAPEPEPTEPVAEAPVAQPEPTEPVTA